ncbi:deaminase [Afifella sp. H1R]|uniref:anti-phage dCTP deaminase n=1 Tax=Afifella sp. H1R TaxID=2908841 RepID=UPI001F47D655|nr:anti-phage dCTP deaminase [Afifella sp. H1R]MCF1504743.1 deaminase [Afifella sp. H1R]
MQQIDPVSFPELIFGTAGPIGVDMDALSRAIAECLAAVGYQAAHIKLTEEMLRFRPGIVPKPKEAGKFAEYEWKMDYANALRKAYERSDALARIAIHTIRLRRAAVTRSRLAESLPTEVPPEEKPLDRHAFIIRQLKHPDEVTLLRKVYGKQFILISAYLRESDRKHNLIENIKTTESTRSLHSLIEYKATKLIERDASETEEQLGQKLRDVFHLADMFIDGSNIETMRDALEKFVNVFFGKTDITPSKDEYGMYAAKSASLRSSDLSRQVGAAIFSNEGEIITQGCNEAPKFGGGTYWDSELPDHRDIKKGKDPNDLQKREILRDVIERLRTAGCLSTTLLSKGNDTEIVSFLLQKENHSPDEEEGPLSNSWLMDLTEFGRIIHAEMSAICDAARLGRSIRFSTLYCTTFPCHNCCKHIIGAGINRVVYMEPYPKSRAKDLHEDEIDIETENTTRRVAFVPFLGISPYRYRDVFQKGRRKTRDGIASTWIHGEPRPILDIDFPSYTRMGEIWALIPLLGDLKDAVA